MNWKIYVAAALAALAAANNVLGWVSPELQAALLTCAATLGFVVHQQQQTERHEELKKGLLARKS